MSTTVSYKNNNITTVNNNTKTLNTSGKWLEADIILTDTPKYYTATINQEGNQHKCYITYESNKYYQLNSSFNFNANDTCLITVIGNRATGVVYIDGTQVTESQNGVIYYTYTLPNKNIDISFSIGNTSYCYITTSNIAGTPIATKGSVSNHSINITPSVTNNTGYVNSGTITGTAVTVSASELVSGTKSITTNGTGIDVTNYASVDVAVPSPSLQAKTNINPTTSSQTITPDSGYGGLSSVQINAMPNGTAGTPTATKGTVSNYSVSVTPSVTNTTGYITGSTKTGTAVSVSASELVSGTKSITANGTGIDVTTYEKVDVSVPNTYSASDEGKVVSSGALVAQTAHADVTPTTSDQTIDTTTNNSLKVKGDADLIAGNIKKDVEIFGVTGSYEGGGGSGIDLSDIHQSTALNNIGGLFTAFENGTWDSLEFSCTSGTSPIEIDFGRIVKGFIYYPKSIAVVAGLATNEQIGLGYATLADPDPETGEQARTLAGARRKAAADTSIFGPRTSNLSINGGVVSFTPTYPSNQSYHPFRFGVTYIFVFWW